MKEAIIDKFQGNWLPFYRTYLPNLKKNGKEWVACCPFHSEKEPSFSIDIERGLYHCFGCGKEGDPFHFYAKRKGLATGPDFREVLEGICKDFNISTNNKLKPSPKLQVVKPVRSELKGEPINTYDYVNENGKLVFQVCRYEDGEFRQRKPGKNGKWINNTDRVKKVLYNLPKVNASQEIWLCEGEKDADNVTALGFTGTTNPMGAGKWQDSYTETLRDKDVFIFADNDDPGRGHAKMVAKKLFGVANSIKIVELPDLPPKGDVSDFIERYKTREEAGEALCRQVDNASHWHPIVDNPLQVQTINDLLAEDLPDNWLVEKLISGEECGFIAGGSKAGKSIFAQNLAISMVGGYRFLNTFDIPRPLKVLYINLEISKKNFQRRFKRMINNAEFDFSKENLIHITRKGFRLDNDQNFGYLEEQVAFHKPEVVILDCLYMAIEMNYSKLESTIKFFQNISALIEKHKITVIVVHHYRKPSTEQKGTNYGPQEMWGSFILNAFGDFYITFQKHYKMKSKLTLDFEMRNCEEPERIVVIRNPETLWYEYGGLKAEERQRGGPAKTVVWDVVDRLKKYGGEMDNVDLKAMLERELEISDKTARNLISQTKMEGYIGPVNPNAKPIRWKLLIKGKS